MQSQHEYHKIKNWKRGQDIYGERWLYYVYSLNTFFYSFYAFFKSRETTSARIIPTELASVKTLVTLYKGVKFVMDESWIDKLLKKN